MKKILLTLIAVFAISSTILAQGFGDRPNRQRMDPAEMIKQRTERMKEQLGLSEEQVAKVQALNEKFMSRQGGQRGQRPEGNDSVRARRDRQNRNVDANTGASAQNNNGEARQRREGGQRGNGMQRGNGNGQRGGFGMRGGMGNMEEYNNELKTILTAEQYAKYEEGVKQMMQRFGQGRRQ